MDQMVNMPMQQQQQDQWRMESRIYEDGAKTFQRNAQKLSFQRDKAILKEAERERIRSQCEMVSVDENGNVSVQTQNLQYAVPKRKVVNFVHPEIIKLCRISNAEERLYLFHFDLQEEIRSVLLWPDKCGSPTYLLKKISAEGGYVMGNTLAKRKEYVIQLLTLLIGRSKERFYLPDRRGWYLDENGKIQFFEGRWTWEEAVKCAN